MRVLEQPPLGPEPLKAFPGNPALCNWIAWGVADSRADIRRAQLRAEIDKGIVSDYKGATALK